MPPSFDSPPLSSIARACPLPRSSYDRVLLGHGSGGRLTADLVRDVFLAAFANPVLSALEDQATLALTAGRLAVTTDSFVVRPLIFPGGDIGRLAVCGTVNDLAVGGAEPRYLTAAFILEEGLPIETLSRIVASMRFACDEAGVTIVAGDTKVVERGKGDGVFITTTGVGLLPESGALSIAGARPGDSIIVSGTLGDHGIAIMSAREGLEFETELVSDCAPLGELTALILASCSPGSMLRAMRDPTRGGLAGAVDDLAHASRVGVEIDETAIPLRPEVHAACEMLGLDPLYVASEGRLVAVVDGQHAGRLLDTMRGHPLGHGAAIIGRVVADHPGKATLRTMVGGERMLMPMTGEQLPRIC